MSRLLCHLWHFAELNLQLYVFREDGASAALHRIDICTVVSNYIHVSIEPKLRTMTKTAVLRIINKLFHIQKLKDKVQVLDF